jgi:hypothetical protein
LYARQVRAAIDQMDVRVVEARQGQSPVQVNHPGPFPGQGEDLCRGPDRGYQAPGTRNRFGLRPGRVNGPYLPVDEDEIGRHLRQRERTEEREKEAGNECFH